MRSVRFIKSMPGRAIGEIAGYTDETAERYVKAGIAEYNGVTPDVSHETDAPLPSRARKQAKAEEDDDPDKRYRDRAQSSAKRIRETISDTGGVYIPGE